MFEKSAYLYDEIYSFLDYSAASEKLHTLIQQFNPKANSLLDVACGTGKHLENLKEYYQTEGLDSNPDLLKIARKRCPEVAFHRENMVNYNLDHQFDVITCLFTSIGYLKTIENAEMALACMTRHLQPGGIVIIEPWVSPENCWTNKVTAEFIDKPELKIVRMYTHVIEDRVSVFDINYLIGTPKEVQTFKEREELGLFTQEEYIDIFEKAGLEVSYYDTDLFPKHKYGLYIGINNER